MAEICRRWSQFALSFLLSLDHSVERFVRWIVQGRRTQRNLPACVELFSRSLSRLVVVENEDGGDDERRRRRRWVQSEDGECRSRQPGIQRSRLTDIRAVDQMAGGGFTSMPAFSRSSSGETRDDAAAAYAAAAVATVMIMNKQSKRP